MAPIQWMSGRDTMDVLGILYYTLVTPGTLLANLDVEALYSFISQDIGYQVISHFLSTRGIYMEKYNQLVLTLLDFA